MVVKQSLWLFISVDEKTGIQALSRLQGRAPKSKSAAQRKEFEYKRNGTTTLMAGLDVATNQVVHQRIHPTRNEEHFLIFTQELVDKYSPKDKIVILADQLNIHLSESLVRWVAELESDDQELGKKGSSGVLQSIKTRKEYLEREQHRLRFVYTPKHCSWLNPIENWFAKLQRHVIRHSNFESVKELSNNIAAYIPYYNRTLSKKIKWKFRGFYKGKELSCIKWAKA